MKKILLIIMLLLLSGSVIAAEYSYMEIEDIPSCYGNVRVRVQNHNNAEDFKIAGCDKDRGDFWICGCNKNGTTLISLQTNNDNIYSLDIITEYDIYNIDNVTKNLTLQDVLKAKRTNEFNDIKIGIVEKPIKIDPPTTTDYLFFIGLAFVIFAVLVGVGIFFVKWLMTDNENDVDFTNTFRKKSKPEETKPQTSSNDEEMLNLLDEINQ